MPSLPHDSESRTGFRVPVEGRVKAGPPGLSISSRKDCLDLAEMVDVVPSGDKYEAFDSFFAAFGVKACMLPLLGS